uniref:Dolichol kinase n=1 Tax=Fervidicoccus fontis TaxID=683846 RepID=A0A7J3ZLS0_9CREN
MPLSAALKVTLTDVAFTLALVAYVLLVALSLKHMYSKLLARGHSESLAAYISRKTMHIVAAGIPTLLVPYLFSTPIAPSIAALGLAGLLYHKHRSNRLMHWFQVRENMYEVNFALAWSASILALWMVTGDMLVSILPALFISIGDGVTGLVRMLCLRKRAKHWLGNIAMMVATLPLGAALAGAPGAIAAIIASLAEKFELKPIDDNILISVASVVTLAVLYP